jgi:hypothetical protein
MDEHLDRLRECAKAGMSVAETARETGLPARSISYAAKRMEGLSFQAGHRKAAAKLWSKPEYREAMMKVCAANQAKRWEGHEVSEKWQAAQRLETLARNCFRFSKLLTPSVEAAAGRRMLKMRQGELPKAGRKRPATRSEVFVGRVLELLGEQGPKRTAEVAELLGVTDKYVAQQLGFAFEDGRVARERYRNGHAGGWLWKLPTS